MVGMERKIREGRERKERKAKERPREERREGEKVCVVGGFNIIRSSDGANVFIVSGNAIWSSCGARRNGC